MEQPLKHQYKFGSIYVNFGDLDENLIYDGDTREIRRKPESSWLPHNKLGTCTSTSIPPFVPTKSYSDFIMKGRTDTYIATELFQSDLKDSFEEVRANFYGRLLPPDSTVFDDLDSLEQTGTKSEGDSGLDLKLTVTDKWFSTVSRLLEVKKRNLSYLAMNLCKTIAHQSKKMDNLCIAEKLPASDPSLPGREVNGCHNERSPNEASLAVTDNSVSSNKGDSAEARVSITDKDSDNCLYCSLQLNLFKTLENLKDCLDVGLNVCEKIENVLNYLHDLTLPNFSIGKRLRKASIAELKCELLLSFQIFKTQTLYGSNLNKLQALLLALIDSSESKDLQRKYNKRMTPVSGNQQGFPKPVDGGDRVILDEKAIPKSSISTGDKTPERSTSATCHLSSILQLQLGIVEFHQFLEVFVKCTKILKPLESLIIRLLCRFLEEAENNVPKSLENITQASEKVFAKPSVSKHHRNPYGEVLVFAKTSDRLQATYKGEVDKIIPHGEGTLSTVKNYVIYQGKWKLGKRHGLGKAFITCKVHPYWSTSGEYKGNWKSNCRHGFGHMVFSDGSVYDGEWEMDKIQGRGVMTRFDGSTLEGYWLDGYPHGCITFTWPHGAMEYREYKNGNILRVYEPRQELSSLTKTVRCIDNAVEEKTYYKYSLRKLKGEIGSLEKRHKKQAEETLVKERAEKIQIINTLQQELEQSQKKQSEEAEKMDGLRKKLDCQICMNNPKNCLLFPCLHFNCCTGCIDQLKAKEPPLKCPTCRQLTNGEIYCKFS